MKTFVGVSMGASEYPLLSIDKSKGSQWVKSLATLCLHVLSKGPPLMLGLFHIRSMVGLFVPMVHVHEGKVGAQGDEYFASGSSR